MTGILWGVAGILIAVLAYFILYTLVQGFGIVSWDFVTKASVSGDTVGPQVFNTFYILIFSLEQRFPAWDASRGAPDGIVVLGGAVTADIAAARKDVALNEAAERMTATVELARRYPNARIIFSGGDGSLVYGGNESDGALRLFERLGLAPGRVELEDQSRNTFENVLFSKRIAAPKPGERWLLVTSAYHVPRAVGMFRMAGFPVEPYPVDWRTRGVEDTWRPFPSLAEGLRRTDTAVREWAGLVIYWLSGRSSELFPGPSAGQ